MCAEFAALNLRVDYSLNRGLILWANRVIERLGEAHPRNGFRSLIDRKHYQSTNKRCLLQR